MIAVRREGVAKCCTVMTEFWSPDSRTIAFFAQGKLKKVDAVGGPPQIIAANVVGPSRNMSGTWNRDGVIVFNMGGSMFRVPAAGGTPGELPGLPGLKERPRFPSFLPEADRAGTRSL